VDEEDAILGDLDKSMEQEGSPSTVNRSNRHRIKSKVAQTAAKRSTQQLSVLKGIFSAKSVFLSDHL
jgi:hypothetical protein